MNPFQDYLKRNGIYLSMVLGGLYVLPIILANFYYVDDLARSVAGYARWSDNGRPLAEYIIKGMSFGGRVIDLAPLPLILSVLVVVLSGYYYCFKAGIEGRVTVAITSVSLLISPFYLQNISYRFDVFTMSLSVAACVTSAAVLLNRSGYVRFLLSGLLIVASLSLYQSSANICIAMIGLNALVSYRYTLFKSTVLESVRYAITIVAALLVYKFCIASIFVSGVYSESHAESASSIESVIRTINAYVWMFQETFTGNYAKAMSLLMITPIIAIICRVVSGKEVGFLIVSAVSLFAIAFSYIGVLVALHDPVIYPRVLVGFCGIVFSGYVVTSLFCKRMTPLLVIPLAASFLLSYSYGNSLSAQNEKEGFIFELVAKEVISHPGVEKIRFNGSVDIAPTASNAAEKSGIIKMITPSYVRSDWMFGAFQLHRMGVKVDHDSAIDIKSIIKADCINRISNNSLFSTIKNGNTLIFDFDKCK
ncbi:glucosyltransferase domain-containing protein [Enterobacter hormaechei]|uniref:glucosyltransferase domain-containing protein n=1 Tax=Enterobacter hormaechei TaxID=158836 RepID=UPI0023EB878D|nr:glucosyltransferase domain-containing protein [Enterobacter hormaechei]